VNTTSLNQQLAHWICDFSWKQIPPHVVEDIKLPPATIVNATGIAGSLAAGSMASWLAVCLWSHVPQQCA
jgi:hypothetical protein